MAVIRKRDYLYPKFMELYNAGMSDYEIASELGYTSGSIARWRKNHGLPSHYPRRRKSILKPRAGDIINMRKSGMTYDQIAIHVGASGDGVRKFCCKLGISV